MTLSTSSPIQGECSHSLTLLPSLSMEHLEGKQSVLAALNARQRRFQVILVSQSTHDEKVQDVLDLAAERNVPVRRVDRKELDALAHGTTHGGVLAIASAKPRLSS